MGKIKRHNGESVVDLVTKNFLDIFNKNLNFKFMSNLEIYQDSEIIQKIAETLTETFLEIDKKIKKDLKKQSEETGTTVLILIIYKRYIITANLGDSRSFIIRNKKPLSLTKDLTPVILIRKI